MSSLPHADSTQGGNGRCLDLLDYSVHSKNKQTNKQTLRSWIIYHLKKLRFWVWKTTTQHKTWQRPKWRGRKTKGKVTVSNGNRGFLEKVARMKRREGKVCKIERGSCVHGAWVVSSTVQELVCFSLKQPRGSAEIQKPVNLQHKNSVGTAPSKWQFHSISVHYWITEAHMQIRQHKTACMCSEYIWMCLCSCGIGKAQRWEPGNLLTLVLCSSPRVK